MPNHTSKKIAIIGPPGSGKSTFASKMGKILNIPVHHLDRHMFEPNGKKRDKIEELRIKYPQTKFIIFTNQKEADRFLQSLTP